MLLFTCICYLIMLRWQEYQIMVRGLYLEIGKGRIPLTSKCLPRLELFTFLVYAFNQSESDASTHTATEWFWIWSILFTSGSQISIWRGQEHEENTLGWIISLYQNVKDMTTLRRLYVVWYTNRYFWILKYVFAIQALKLYLNTFNDPRVSNWKAPSRSTQSTVVFSFKIGIVRFIHKNNKTIFIMYMCIWVDLAWRYIKAYIENYCH